MKPVEYRIESIQSQIKTEVHIANDSNVLYLHEAVVNCKRRQITYDKIGFLWKISRVTLKNNGINMHNLHVIVSMF